MAERHRGRLAMVAARLVGVRCTELALQLPDEVRQLASRRDARQQRGVAWVQRVPVDARHVRGPELVALQAPHLAQHLRPLGGRQHGRADAVQVDPPALARRCLGLRSFAVGLAVAHEDAQALVVADRQRDGVGRQCEGIDAIEERFRLHRREVEQLEPSRAFPMTAAAVRTDQRQRRPQHLAAGHARDLPEPAFHHRERRDALRDAVEVDHDRRLAGAVFGGRALVAVVGLQALGFRIERGPAAALQRDQVRPHRAREGEFELHAVVDRIERAHRQEVQVLALGIEGGGKVAELRLRRQRCRAARHVVELDRRVPCVGPERVGEPRAVGRPRGVFGASRVAALDQRQRACVDIAQQHFVAMVGDRDPRAGGRRLHRDDAAHVPRHRARGAVLEYLDALLARAVAYRDERGAVGQPLPETVARTVAHAELAHAAFPQREREGLAAHVDREAVPRRMQREAAQVVAGGHELACRLRTMRGHRDVDARGAVGGGVEQPDIAAAVIDDALAVGARIAREIVVVIGVAPLVAAVGPARVQVAHALAVGDEVHALADPHRRRDVAGQLAHAPERAGARRIDPQVTGAAAAVALPAGGIAGIAAEHHRVARTERQMVHLSQRQQLRHAAGRIERERAVVAEERLPVRRHERNVPLRRPAAHLHVGAEPGHAPRGTARGRHQVHLRVLLVAAHERERAAVGGEGRGRRFAQAGGEAARIAAIRGHAPQVVVADECDGVAVDRGEAQVAEIVHRDGSRDAGRRLRARHGNGAAHPRARGR